jgi:hypothetical protein
MKAAKIGRQFNYPHPSTPLERGGYLHKSFDFLGLNGHIFGPFQHTR